MIRMLISLFVAALLASPALAQRAELFVSGLSKPVDFQADPTSKSRFYIVEQTGSIRVVENGKLLEKPFLTIPKERFTDKGWEQGLLGLAFDPGYAENKRFYVNYTNEKGDTHVSRFVAKSAQEADVESEEVILFVDQPYANHNGGCVRFGPDGMLYIGMGDGGSAGDPQSNAQDLSTLLGKMLRIDVTSKPQGDPPAAKYVIPKDNPFVGEEDAKPEIWAYGLRNPWRYEFDSKGRLWIADVGQNKFEWILLQPADSKGGENYGWNVMEGPEPFTRRRRARGAAEQPPERAEVKDSPAYVEPLFSYRHAPVASVTGGFFYEGKKIDKLKNRYIFGEFMLGKVQSFQLTQNGKAYAVVDHTADLAPAWGSQQKMQQSISSFGKDAEGELYVCDLAGGRVFKLVP